MNNLFVLFVVESRRKESKARFKTRENSLQQVQITLIKSRFIITQLKIDSMPTFNIPSSPKRKYSRILLKTKTALIKLIFRKSVSFDDAIRQLGIKKTTAINIINRYRETGSFPVRKYRKISKKTKDQHNSKTQHPPIKREQENPEQPNYEPTREMVQNQQQSEPYPSQILWVYYPMIYYPVY